MYAHVRTCLITKRFGEKTYVWSWWQSSGKTSDGDMLELHIQLTGIWLCTY